MPCSAGPGLPGTPHPLSCMAPHLQPAPTAQRGAECRPTLVGQWDVQVVGPGMWKYCSLGGSLPQEWLRDALQGWCCSRELQGLHKGECTCCHEPMGSQEELRGDLHLHLTL